MLLKIILWIILLFIILRFVVRFFLPVFSIFRITQEKLRQMQNMQGNQQHSASGTNTSSSRRFQQNSVPKEGDYIDYEEVK